MKKIFTLVAGVFLFATTLSAQSLTDFLKGAATSVVDEITGGKATEALLPGSWSYADPAVRLVGSDVLADMLANTATQTIESKLKKAYEYAGIKSGACSFTFDKDGVFSMMVGKRTLSGTYTFEAATHKLQLLFDSSLIKLGAMTGYAFIDGDNVDLVFDCPKLFDLIVKLGAKVSSLSALTAIVEKYDGMMLGFSLTRN